MLKSTSNPDNTDAASSCIATTSHATQYNMQPTTNGNIISLVSLGSPQKSTKIFPWTNHSTNNNQLNSPTKSILNDFNLALSPLNLNSSNSNSSTTSTSNNNTKQIIRPQLMIGNNNRINIANLNRPLSESIHVVLKKPSNQTIVIVSKPPQQQPSTSNDKILETNATNSNIKINNFLMSINNKSINNQVIGNSFINQLNNNKKAYEDAIVLPLSYNDTDHTTNNKTSNQNMPINIDFNNNNLLNAKPIKLIPIKKINHISLNTSLPTTITTTTTSTDVPIINNDKSINELKLLNENDLTTDINRTLTKEEDNDDNNNKTSPKTNDCDQEPQQQINNETSSDSNIKSENDSNNKTVTTTTTNTTNKSNETPQKSVNSQTKSKNNTKINKQNVSKGDDVTRCICEMNHDDGFMICCDKCL